jgi:predicted Rossmann-fold nucleotide-binding protein
VLRAKALVVFPGGYGTLDELFEVLTLRQTGRMQQIPVILFGREFWSRAVDFQFLADEGVIHDVDLDLFRYAETPAEAWEMIQQFHRQ